MNKTKFDCFNDACAIANETYSPNDTFLTRFVDVPAPDLTGFVITPDKSQTPDNWEDKKYFIAE